jgi:MFS transporter, SP family, solute carrier family 2 (myo-inositol transporter), member 13
MTLKTGGNLVDGSDYSKTWSGIILASMIIYVASYATGLGNVPWHQGELFSLEGGLLYLLKSQTSRLIPGPSAVRGIGTSLSTATNWAGNLLIGSTYLSLMDRITPSGAFGFYASVLFLIVLDCDRVTQYIFLQWALLTRMGLCFILLP